MPLIKPDLIKALLRDHLGLTDAPDRITLPVYDGRRGNPVIWGRMFFDGLMSLTGDWRAHHFCGKQKCDKQLELV